jgi:hypothetical protein
VSATPSDARHGTALHGPPELDDPMVAPLTADDRSDAEVARTAGSRRAHPLLAPASVVLLGFFISLVLFLARGVMQSESGAYSAGIIVTLIALVSVGVFWWLQRRHPDEPFLFKVLLAGLLFKFLCSYLRFLTLKVGYNGIGDAFDYDNFGHRWADAVLGGYTRPQLADASETNFVRYLTGVVYVGLGGPTIIGGFLVYGCAAFWGAYLWYRAAVEALPNLNKRLFLLIVMFLPSIAFWPASIGKEAVMNLGLGGMAYGSSLLLRRRGVGAVALLAPSTFLVLQVRPHLAAIFGIALATAYVLGRVTSNRRMVAPGLTRIVGVIVVIGLAAVTAKQAADFLNLQGGISRSSIEQGLAAQSSRNTEGGSSFDTPNAKLSVTSLPGSLFTTLFRPLPYEATSGFIAIAALENAAILGFAVLRIRSLGWSLRNIRKQPFIMFCLVIVVIYGAIFSSFGNFGLLVRQRSLALPAFFAILAIDPPRKKAKSLDGRVDDARALPLPPPARRELVGAGYGNGARR